MKPLDISLGSDPPATQFSAAEAARSGMDARNLSAAQRHGAAQVDDRPKKEWGPGDILVGQFEVERLLGQGGMGEVFQVRNLVTNTRYAVKRIRVRAPRLHQRLLSEIRAWLRMPASPHVARFYFARTISDELTVFSEYVDGGSLSRWIRDKKLVSVEQIIDISIQCAWGLVHVHKAGLLHQDVKPANLLLNNHGIIKVSDFGLAQAHSIISQEDPGAVHFAYQGMTPAYGSPEQFANKPLTYQTDIWSFGLVLLEMFAGGIFWQRGTDAESALQQYLNESAGESKKQMPAAVAELLCRCFAQDPQAHWESMEAISRQLICIYKDFTGKDYQRPWIEQAAEGSGRGCNPVGIRRLLPAQADEPEFWLALARRIDGYVGTEQQEPSPGDHRGAQHRAFRELALWQDSLQILEKHYQQGLFEAGYFITLLHFYKGESYELIPDWQGAKDCLEQAIKTCEESAQRLNDPAVRTLLPSFHRKLGLQCRNLGQLDDALLHFENALEATAWLPMDPVPLEFAAAPPPRLSDGSAAQVDGYGAWRQVLIDLWRLRDPLLLGNDSARANILLNKANLFCQKEEFVLAKSIYAEGIKILQELVERYGLIQYRTALAHLLMNSTQTDDSKEKIIESLTKAINLLEETLGLCWDAGSAMTLAASYLNFTELLISCSDSLLVLDKSIRLYEKILQESDSVDALNGVAKAYHSKAITLFQLKRIPQARHCFDQTIAALEELILRRGVAERLETLAYAYSSKAALQSKTELPERIALLEKSIDILDGLVRIGRHDLASKLDALRRSLKSLLPSDNATQKEAFDAIQRGQQLVNQGQITEGIQHYDFAIQTLTSIAEQGIEWQALFNLASAHKGKGAALRLLGNMKAAVESAEEAIQILEALSANREEIHVWTALGGALLNQANALTQLSETAQALVRYDRAIMVIRRIPDQDNNPWIAETLGRAYGGKSSTLANLQRLAEAITCAQRAIALLQPLATPDNMDLRVALAALKGNLSAYQSLLQRGSGSVKVEVFVLNGSGVQHLPPQAVAHHSQLVPLAAAVAAPSGTAPAPAPQPPRRRLWVWFLWACLLGLLIKYGC